MSVRKMYVVISVLAMAAGARGGMVTRRWGTPPSGPSAAPAARPQAKPPTCYVVDAGQPPTLDGKLDDPAWQRSPVYRLARTLDGAGSAPQPTEVRLLRDGANLYIGARCTEPLLGKIQASRRSHDGEIWRDDSLEFFIGVGGTYYQFGINAVGSTMDARRKDGSWNSGLKAAAGRERGAWTLEVAIPLRAMVGEGAIPTEWTANFNRNRYAAGTWQESAWSPTFSGDSHVPARFGRMLFRDPPPEERVERPVVKREEVEILPAEGAEGVVWFDLTTLPAKAAVIRADLLVFRTTKVDGRMDEARTGIRIRPLAGEKPGEPLKLRASWFDRLDATEAVRRWAAGAPNGGFRVEACPFWTAEATCLDVWYEGTPKDVPPQVTGVRALHRAGQTFITWREIDDPVGRDDIAWGDLKRILDRLDSRHRLRYCVYRHDRRITADNLHEAALLAAVRPLSGWNVDGRNIDRPIDHVLATQEVLPTHHWSPFRNASIDGQYGRDCPVDRFTIEEGKGPLPRSTGLYVHTASGEAKAWYAVVTSIDGVQNTAALSPANAPAAGVAETPAAPEPVLQRELPRMPWFNYDERRLHYVRWVAPPLTHLPSQAHNWSAGVPNRMGDSVPLELSLHRDGHSYWRTQYRIERDSIVVSPYDFPIKSWWHGYHESLGTLRSFRQGAIQPFTERRLLSFIDWACRRWPVDRARMLVTGCRGGAAGSGALHLGLRHPDVFSLVIAGHPAIDYASAAVRTDRHGRADALAMQAVWGKPMQGGKGFWSAHDAVAFVRSLPAGAELPFVAMTSNHGDEASRRFYQAMLDRRSGILGQFEWGGTRYLPVSRSATFANVIRLDIRRASSFLACASAAGRKLVDDGKMGALNLQFRWRNVADEPDRYEATLFLVGRGGAIADVTPRRLQRFKPVKGTRYRWTNGKQSGEVTVGGDGLLVLPGVQFAAEGTRLTIVPK